MLRIGGYPATEIAAHTAPTYETLADGGTGEVSFAFALSPRAQHPALRPGSLVEGLVGGLPVFRAALGTPDRTTWECKAYGLQAERFYALDGSGSATRNLGLAISNAIAAGFRIRNPQGHGAGYTVPGDTTEPQLVMDLLREAAVGQRVGIRPDGAIYVQTDPTVISYRATPDAAIFGTTDESTASHLVVRYFNGTANVTTIFGPVGPRKSEELVDLTSRGTLTSGQVATIIDAAMPDKRALGFTNGVTLHREQLTTVGGTPAYLPAVRAGVLTRADGVISARASLQTPYLDFVIGKTRHTIGSPLIYVEPVNASPVAGGLSDILAAA